MNGRHTWFKGMEQVHMEDCHVTTSTCHPPMPSLNAHDYCYSSSNLLYMYTCSWIHMCTAACAFILVWHLDDKNCCLFRNGSGRNYLSWDWNTFKCALCAVLCKAAQLIFLGASHQLYLSLSRLDLYIVKQLATACQEWRRWYLTPKVKTTKWLNALFIADLNIINSPQTAFLTQQQVIEVHRLKSIPLPLEVLFLHHRLMSHDCNA